MWPHVPLKSISTLGPQYGAGLRAVGATPGGVRYVRITDIDDYGQLRPDSVVGPDEGNIDEYVLEEGDLLFARSGATVGKTYRYTKDDGPCVFAGYLIRFRPNSRIVIPSYLAYYFQSAEYWAWVRSKKRVAAQPNINGAEYAALELPLPPIREQHRIVELLDEADRLRQLRRKADAKVADILPALFAGRFGVPDFWKQSEPLGKLVSIQSGGTPSKTVAEFWQGSIPWVSPKDMKRDEIEDAEDHVSESAIAQAAVQRVPIDSVLIVVRGMILARDVPVAIARRPVTINQDMKALILNDQRLDPLYLFASLKTQTARLLAEVTTAAHGTKKLETNRLANIPIRIPSPSELHSFSSAYGQLLAVDRLRAAAGPRIDELFSLLLRRAFSGQLTAKWRQSHMKELLDEMEQQARLLSPSLPLEATE